MNAFQEGSLPFEVKPKEAPKLLPGQTTSDATILQPNSPGRIESLQERHFDDFLPFW